MRLFFAFCALLFSNLIFSQTWTEVSKENIEVFDKVDINVDDARTYKLDDSAMKTLLWKAPHEDDVFTNGVKGALIQFPLASGKMDFFYVYQYDMMEEELAKKYSEIRTFIGISRSHPGRKIRIDYTHQGVRAVIRDDKGMTYIDHFQRNDKQHRIVYDRNAFQTDKKINCGVGLEKMDLKMPGKQSNVKLLGECELKTYRYAQTTTGEYSNFHGATSSAQSGLVLSAVTTTLNRVNEVYEQDLTVRFVLIANTDDIFYYNANTDPFNGSSASNMISANQTNTDNVIGSGNYDIGHIFSTGGSGLAGLGVVCLNENKARGVTGISSPVGDPFDIDYVSHEVGHQCGGNHTQNNNCNRSGTSVEVGSGYTIMGYAGICSPNVINNSIAMFNTANIIEMTNYLGGTSCNNVISTYVNSAPIAQVIEDKIIPHSTPFLLDVSVSDPDSDPLFHAWEQQDNEVATMPPASTNTGGPTFRSYLPTSESERYYPPISNIVNGTSNTWEVLPSVARDLNFIYTARDISFAAGCIDTARVKLTVDGSAGPFNVTSQSTSQTYSEYENVIVTWDVGNTDLAPIFAQYVDILYSRDGGFTYPDTLVHQTYNDGVREVVIPGGLENDARFMVKANDNYFLDINEADISVTNSGASFNIELDKFQKSFCTSETNPYVININAEAFEGFTGTIDLALQGVPAGLTATLGANSISETGATTLTLDNFAITPGIDTIFILGTNNGLVRTQEFILDVIETGSTTVTLASPADASIEIVNNPILSWQSVSGVSSYEYEILNSAGSIIESNIVTNNSVVVNTVLGLSQTYTWKVRPIFACGSGNFSNTFSFSTGTCLNYVERTPVVIPTTASIVNSVVNIPVSGTISDVNIIDLDISHSWIEDLEITLTSPATNSAILYDNTCGQEDDIFLSYDDNGVAFDCTLRTSGNTVQPVENLSVFNSTDINGNWDLQIEDVANQDGGTLNSWTLQVCYTSSCDLNVDKIAFDDGAGSLKDALDCATSGDVISFDTSLPTDALISVGNERIIIDKNITFSIPANRTVSLRGTTAESTIEILSSGSLSANSLTVTNITTNDEVIKNAGSLNINNVTVISNSTAIGIDNTNGILTATGTNSIEEN